MATTQSLSSVNYTTNDAVRGALGLSVRELPNDQMDNMGLGTRLEVDLEDWMPSTGVVTPYQLQIDPSLAGKTFTLYCTAFCALEVCKRLPLLAALRVSDGKNELERQPVDYAALEDTLRADLRSARRHLERVISESTTPLTITAFNPFVSATPTYNPITNT